MTPALAGQIAVIVIVVLVLIWVAFLKWVIALVGGALDQNAEDSDKDDDCVSCAICGGDVTPDETLCQYCRPSGMAA